MLWMRAPGLREYLAESVAILHGLPAGNCSTKYMPYAEATLDAWRTEKERHTHTADGGSR